MCVICDRSLVKDLMSYVTLTVTGSATIAVTGTATMTVTTAINTTTTITLYDCRPVDEADRGELVAQRRIRRIVHALCCLKLHRDMQAAQVGQPRGVSASVALPQKLFPLLSLLLLVLLLRAQVRQRLGVSASVDLQQAPHVTGPLL